MSVYQLTIAVFRLIEGLGADAFAAGLLNLDRPVRQPIWIGNLQHQLWTTVDAAHDDRRVLMRVANVLLAVALRWNGTPIIRCRSRRTPSFSYGGQWHLRRKPQWLFSGCPWL